MKKTLLAVIMLLPAVAFAQTVTGKISQTGNVVPYVEVIAIKDQKKQTAISDEKGNYSLKLSENGTYNIKLIQDGIEVSNKELMVNGEVKHDFFIEKKKEKQIEGVTLTARKKLIERKADRLVFQFRGFTGNGWSGCPGNNAIGKSR
jgi:uncharacterized protein YxeA